MSTWKGLLNWIKGTVFYHRNKNTNFFTSIRGKHSEWVGTSIQAPVTSQATNVCQGQKDEPGWGLRVVLDHVRWSGKTWNPGDSLLWNGVARRLLCIQTNCTIFKTKESLHSDTQTLPSCIGCASDQIPMFLKKVNNKDETDFPSASAS